MTMETHLCIGGPLDGKRHVADKAPFFVPEVVAFDLCDTVGQRIEPHTTRYDKVRLGGINDVYEVYLSDDVKDPIARLLEKYPGT